MFNDPGAVSIAHRPDVHHRDRREVLPASTDNSTYLRSRNDPLGGWSQANVRAAQAPVAVSVNGTALPRSDWAYSPGEQLLTLKGLAAGTVMVRFKRA